MMIDLILSMMALFPLLATKHRSRRVGAGDPQTAFAKLS